MSKSSILAGVALIALTATAAADTPAGTYVGLAAGANWLEDYEAFGSTDFDTGYYVGGLVGYKWTNGIRAEFEASFRDNGFGFMRSGDVDNRALSGMINVLYDLDVGEGMALSLGGGIGASRVSFVDHSFGDIEGRDVVFAYQGIAEFEAMVDDNVGLYLGYNYFVADNWDITFGQLGAAQDDYVAHTVKLGVKYHFYQAPVVEAPPPPPLPPAPPAKTFIVFFNFDKSDLTAEAQAVVAEAAATYASTGSVSIAVVGHTDTVGSAAYNLPLSQRRAASVKAGLVANGVPEGAISTDGKGFSEPLVATGPGVKEPQNRRATIDLTGSGT